MVAKEIRYLSPRKIRERMDVSAGTVRRWAKQYGWERKNINARVIRYLATDVEQSLGVSFK
jgi:transposase